MPDHHVNVFFYGSYMNFSVLAEAGISQRQYEVARLPGYTLTIWPLANLVRKLPAQVFGIVTKLTHEELEHLYGEHAQAVLGGIYQPEAVIVLGDDDTAIPALCYIAHALTPGPPDPGYVDRIHDPALEYEFPPEYLEHILSFKTGGDSR